MGERTVPAGLGRPWVSAHIYHQGDLDRLLVELVQPLLSEVPGGAPEFFFLRYWEGGPHLRLRLRATEHARADALRRLVCDRVGDYLARHPSADRLDEESYAQVAAVLARREGVGDPAPLRPNDSLRFEAYHYDVPRFGVAARPAVEQHFTESSRLALALLRAGLPAARRDRVALSGIVLAALAAGGAGNEGGHWRWWGPDDPTGAWEATCRLGFEKQQSTVVRSVRGLRAAAAGRSPWAQDVDRVWWTSATRLRAGLPYDDPAAARVLDVCAHLLCNRLGLTPSREGYLRYLAARAAAALDD
ncbi:lantibiotic dehydratase C-terminal domain-containing protein [Streptomyces sp. ODS05-4]|uniref:lantibiotic dehydratase C-terminal domain-containing protein n=1 Tax=Streptomyces sp. ODS05-4 TaxID=2944939 RepID=UPI002109549B|nr:lantibiotic dehydratase C-terminal domain-containing protein [Streptomyces sp. ODS05-4]